MPYLNLDIDYFDHRKTRRLVGLLGRGAEVLPIRLWSYCGKFHCEDGRLADYSEQEIESFVAWWGKSGEMVPALEKCGFIARDEVGLFIHGWLEHQGHIAAFKLKGKMMAERRWGKKDAASIAASIAATPLKQCPNQPTNQPSQTKPTEPTKIPPAEEAGAMLRIGRWFKRRPETQWSEKEHKALKAVLKMETPPEDWAILEAYYTASIPDRDNYRRRDIATLLNNWNGEIDRARTYRPKAIERNQTPELISVKSL